MVQIHLPVPSTQDTQTNHDTTRWGWWLVTGLGWLTLYFDIPLPAQWADGNLAESAGLLGIMVEHPNQSQPNPETNHHPHPVLFCTHAYKCYSYHRVVTTYLPGI